MTRNNDTIEGFINHVKENEYASYVLETGNQLVTSWGEDEFAPHVTLYKKRDELSKEEQIEESKEEQIEEIREILEDLFDTSINEMEYIEDKDIVHIADLTRKDVITFSQSGRKRAIRQAQNAMINLQTAAESLGYEDMTDMAVDLHNDNISPEYRYVAENIANAYSYLDSAAIHKLNPDDE